MSAEIVQFVPRPNPKRFRNRSELFAATYNILVGETSEEDMREVDKFLRERFRG